MRLFQICFSFESDVSKNDTKQLILVIKIPVEGCGMNRQCFKDHCKRYVLIRM